MVVLDNKTDDEIIKSLLSEIAKSNNEINCALGDLAKAKSRLNFLVVLANELIKRNGD